MKKKNEPILCTPKNLANPWHNVYANGAYVTFLAYCKFSGSNQGREFDVKITQETEDCQLRIGNKAQIPSTSSVS